MNHRQTMALVSFFMLLSGLSVAQQPDSSLLSLDRLFDSGEFRGESFSPSRWIDEGNGYTTLEPSRDVQHARDIIRYDTESGRREILVPAGKLIPPGQSLPLGIQGYEWSQDGGKLLIFTNSKRVWRRNTRGDYWVVDLKTWGLKKLGGNAAQSTLMFAQFSPDGQTIAYVRENNLYVEDFATNRITALTHDGSPTRSNGTFDWVYEEEFSDRDGFRWSPDGKSIAYWQLDAEKVPIFQLINNTDSLYPVATSIRYPKAGENNSMCRIGVVSATGGDTRWMNVPGDPSNNYIPRMEWAANSDELIFQHLNRLQNTNEAMFADIHTGNVRVLFTDRDSTWVDVVDDMQWIGKGRSVLWESEWDGWKHVYRIGRDGGDVELITAGQFDVMSVTAVDEKGGWLYFMASPDDPIRNALFRMPLTRKGALERITPANQKGTHQYRFSPDARWAIHTYSTVNSPPVVELVTIPAHRVVRTFVDNARLRAKIQGLRRRPAEFFRVDIGGVRLDGLVMKPFDFDTAKRYPVLFHVYGEPASQTVLDRWGGVEGLWHTMLTQKGYVVVSIDNRGTPAPRGRDWRHCIYRRIGILASEEQAAAARIVGRWNFIDSTRFGIWGWSGGGSMSLNAIFRYPDVYATAIAVASVPNQRYYDTIYQERYMGLPQDNPDGYRNGSPITFADRLRGNLLLIHGSGDDNVHYQGAEALINALIAADKSFSMMEYPNRSHGISEGKNTSLHLFSLMTRYLLSNLTPGPVPH